MSTGLTIYRQLDPKQTTPAFKAFIVNFEAGNPDFVDAERVRDYIWTDEIVAATTGYALVDQQGQKLADFKTLLEAETAKASARIVFDVRLADADAD